MALIRRVTRLITADMHAVLDQLEEPEIVLKQAIREMEEELARQVRHGQWLTKEIESLRGRIESLSKNLAEIDPRLDLCFEANNEDLARRLVRKKLETARLRDALETRLVTLVDEQAEHEDLVAANRDQLEGMREKAELLAVDNAAGHLSLDPATGVGPIDEAEIEIAFMDEKQARTSS